MFSTSISRFSFRMAALVGSLALFSLGCGRQDKKDVGALQTVPYAEAMKKCPDKVRPALIFTENFSTNKYFPLMTPAIKITNGELLFQEDSLCVDKAPKVIPAASASAIASAPVPTVSAIATASAPPTVSAPVPSATVKVVPSTGPVRTAPPNTATTGGFRP